MLGVTTFFATVSSIFVPFLGKVIFALIVWLVGKFVIDKALKLIEKNSKFQSLEGTVKSFVFSFIKIAMYVVLIISIVGILGIQTSSIIAVLASAGVAVGLALQGALSNLAGGIMLVIFKPFKIGDYVEAAGAAGVVKEVTLFYTVLTTLDNVRITIPNGSLMNANVLDYSSEENRRVDLTFACAKSESPEKIEKILLETMNNCDKVIDVPEPPFACVSGGTNESMEFTARAWTKSENYWDVYFELNHNITERFGKEGVAAPVMHISSEK